MIPQEKAKNLIAELAIRELTDEQKTKVKEKALRIVKEVKEALKEFSEHTDSSLEEIEKVSTFWDKVEEKIKQINLDI